MKLKLLLSNKFSKLHLNTNEKKYFKIFDQCLDYVFPNTQEIVKHVAAYLDLKNQSDMHYRMHKFLPHELIINVHDYEWLAKYVKRRVGCLLTDGSIGNLKLKKVADGICALPKDIPLNMVEKYVATSKKFSRKCFEYEEDIIKACIRYCQKYNEMNDDFNSFDYDYNLRLRILTSGIQLGIPSDIVEQCIEKNADMWREDAMRFTILNSLKIRNKYLNKQSRAVLRLNDPEVLHEYEARETAYQHLLFRRKELMYYKSHKYYIDKCGTVTENMKMNFDQESQLIAEICKVENQFFGYTDILIKASQAIRNQEINL